MSASYPPTHRNAHDSKALRTVRRCTPVLAVLHHDGFVEVFGDRQVDARVVVMPAMHTQEGECLAEEYVMLGLPQRFRAIYVPGLRRATGLVERIRPSDIERRALMVDLLKAIDRSVAGNKEVAR